MSANRTAPSPEQLEITLMGPGYGESILIHLGSGNWMLVDSCRDHKTSKAAALSYLEEIEVDPREAIKLIIATHWHDDHIRGLADVVEQCPEAIFCASPAMTQNELLGIVDAYNKRTLSKASSGVQELYRIATLLEGHNTTYAAQDRRIFTLTSSETAHGHECAITTLSPCDEQQTIFLQSLAELLPQTGETQRRCLPQGPNHIAVVTLVEIGPISILLGSDLEETKNINTGWSVIVASKNRPQTTSSIFKIPHHGSANAHNDDVWKKMLQNDPYALLTPYNRGHKLPTQGDEKRIATLTPNAFSTASSILKKEKQHTNQQNPKRYKNKGCRTSNWLFNSAQRPWRAF